MNVAVPFASYGNPNCGWSTVRSWDAPCRLFWPRGLHTVHPLGPQDSAPADDHPLRNSTTHTHIPTHIPSLGLTFQKISGWVWRSVKLNTSMENRSLFEERRLCLVGAFVLWGLQSCSALLQWAVILLLIQNGKIVDFSFYPSFWL